MMSRFPRSDGRGRGGQTGHWLIVGALRNHRGIQLYDLGGDVEARDTPSIRGRKKETLDKSLVVPLNLGGSLTDAGCPALDSSGVDPSNSMRMYGLMHGSTPPNRS
jgi:hypothetical protein